MFDGNQLGTLWFTPSKMELMVSCNMISNYFQKFSNLYSQLNLKRILHTWWYRSTISFGIQCGCWNSNSDNRIQFEVERARLIMLRRWTLAVTFFFLYNSWTGDIMPETTLTFSIAVIWSRAISRHKNTIYNIHWYFIFYFNSVNKPNNLRCIGVGGSNEPVASSITFFSFPSFAGTKTETELVKL